MTYRPTHLLVVAVVWLLSASGTKAAGGATQSSPTQLLHFTQVAGGLQALGNGTILTGTFKYYEIDGNTCSSNSSLNMELWNLEGGGTGGSIGQQPGVSQPFLVANRGIPPTSNFNVTANAWTFDPETSLTDLAGESLSRPYLKVDTTFGNGQNGSDWFIMVLNSQIGLPGIGLLYQLRVTCADAPVCPAPVWGGASNATIPCSGNGHCQVTDETEAECNCTSGWGGTGCNQQVTELTAGVPLQVNGVPPGEWRYFAITVPDRTTTLIAEMRRTRGDPILFLKGDGEGREPGALPSSLDFPTYADATSWRTRSDSAQIIRTNIQSGLYHVGVLNNAEDIQEASNFTLAVMMTQTGAICPWNCSGNGVCSYAQQCQCNSGFGGQYCDGPLTPLTISNTASGVLQPGTWAYFRLDLTNKDTRSQALTVKFGNTAGQSIVLASFGIFPTLLNNNFTFRTGQITGQMSQVLQPASLVADYLNFGVYNMNFYVHTPFSFQLSVSQTKTGKADYTSWISVGAALGCSGLIVILIYHGHRAMQRRRLGARGWEMWSWRAMPVVQPLPRRRRSERRRGMDPELVNTFPTYLHDAEKLAKGISQTPKAEQASEDEKGCSVCLAEYEDGDLIRQLLPCHHDFHCKCIDQWLSKNSTCPMCRISLAPAGHQTSSGVEAVGGGEVDEDHVSTSRPEIRIEMIEAPEGQSLRLPQSDADNDLLASASMDDTLPSSQHSVAGSSIEDSHRKEDLQALGGHPRTQAAGHGHAGEVVPVLESRSPQEPDGMSR